MTRLKNEILPYELFENCQIQCQQIVQRTEQIYISALRAQ